MELFVRHVRIFAGVLGDGFIGGFQPYRHYIPFVENGVRVYVGLDFLLRPHRREKHCAEIRKRFLPLVQYLLT